MKGILENKMIRYSVWTVGGLFLLVAIAVLIVNLVMCLTMKKHIVSLEQVKGAEKKYDCILILGAGVWGGDTPSHMLEDRLKVGVALYERGASERLLMSGDHMQKDYDEVGVMKRYAIDAGVPSNVIFLDHAGLSTYESMWRAKELFGVKKVLIVTQGYHLCRAIYLAQQLGMEADGVAADLRPYRSQWSREVREIAARVKDLIYAAWKPLPTYLGDAVDLSGDGDSTNVNKLLEE